MDPHANAIIRSVLAKTLSPNQMQSVYGLSHAPAEVTEAQRKKIETDFVLSMATEEQLDQFRATGRMDLYADQASILAPLSVGNVLNGILSPSQFRSFVRDAPFDMSADQSALMDQILGDEAVDRALSLSGARQLTAVGALTHRPLLLALAGPPLAGGGEPSMADQIKALMEQIRKNVEQNK